MKRQKSQPDLRPYSSQVVDGVKQTASGTHEVAQSITEVSAATRQTEDAIDIEKLPSPPPAMARTLPRRDGK